MHALIIEDDLLIALLLEDLLREQGYESFAVAVTEDQAVAAADRAWPDLITADLHLRAGSGIAAVRRICNGRAPAVVYVTGSRPDLDGVPGAIIVDKPIQETTLRTAVDRARAAAPRH
ncbi:response regulator [Rhodospirillaceae bacterium SYSU D60014]|uniref:response regulator n=1 Tax=Virgifigura deserti TaxID=2268457 RepID=UPI000E66B50A